MFGRTQEWKPNEIPVAVCLTADDVRRAVRRKVPKVPVVQFRKPEPEPIPIQPLPEPVSEYPTPVRPDGPRALIIEVCKRHLIPVSDFFSKSRKAAFVHARQEAAYLLRTERGLSFPTIARVFGMDHSTIIHAVRRHSLELARRAA